MQCEKCLGKESPICFYTPQHDKTKPILLITDTPMTESACLGKEAFLVLNQRFEKFNIDMNLCNITPALKCKTEISKDTVKWCRPILLQEIKTLLPDLKLIVSIGSDALYGIFGRRIAISRCHGEIQWLDFPKEEIEFSFSDLSENIWEAKIKEDVISIKYKNRWVKMEEYKEDLGLLIRKNVNILIKNNEAFLEKYHSQKVQAFSLPVLPIFHPMVFLNAPDKGILWDEAINKINSILFTKEIFQKPELEFSSEKSLLVSILENEIVSIDIETSSLSVFSDTAKVLSIAVSSGKKTFTSLIHHKLGNISFGSEIMDLIKEFLINPRKKVIFHNALFDVEYLEFLFKFKTKALIYDTMMMHYLSINETQGTHGLKKLATIYTSFGGYEDEIQNWLKKNIGANTENWTYEDVPTDILLKYNALDALCTFTIYEKLYKYMVVEKQTGVYSKIIRPAQRLLLNMKQRGVSIDLELARKFSQEWEALAESILIKIRNRDYISALEKEFTEEERNRYKTEKKQQSIPSVIFNPTSNKHMKKLMETLGIQDTTKKGNISSDKGTIDKYKVDFPVLQDVVDYRHQKKMLSLYGRETLETWLGNDGRAHPNFLLHGTKTGRLSSQNPNFQNFPRFGGKVRGLIVSRFPQGKIISADYSQMELRILAYLSEDSHLIDIFKTNRDIHKEVAKKIFRLEEEQYNALDEVTQVSYRFISKMITFGIIYGRGAVSVYEQVMANGISITVEDAQEYIRAFFLQYPGVASWKKNQIAFVKKHKYVVSAFGRKRRLWSIDSASPDKVAEAERQSINMPIQSTASDVTLLAACRIDERLTKENWKTGLIGLVHDELVFDAPSEEVEKVSVLIKKEMLTDIGIFIPFKVSIEIGDNWEEQEEIKI